MAKPPNQKLASKTKKIGEKVLKKIKRKFAVEDQNAAVDAVIAVINREADIMPVKKSNTPSMRRKRH